VLSSVVKLMETEPEMQVTGVQTEYL
jgi:hypothetical protein